MTSLADKVLKIHEALDAAGIGHAFGGALSLAWCTGRARGTIDIDVNVFAPAEDAERILAGFPRGVRWNQQDVDRCLRDGQVRLWWGETPVDVFTNTTAFHQGVSERSVGRPFAGEMVPFLCCDDLAVFKAFFNRTRDWADIEEMIAAGTLDVDRALGVLLRYLGPDDERVLRLRDLAPPR